MYIYIYIYTYTHIVYAYISGLLQMFLRAVTKSLAQAMCEPQCEVAF